MASHAASWPTVACRDCRMDSPRELMTKVKSNRIVFNLCPACMARRDRLGIPPFEIARNIRN